MVRPMHRQLIALAIVLIGCGAQDDRAPNLDYITETILRPTCGTAVCHSTFRQEQGYIFDTVEGSRHTFQSDEILTLPSNNEDRNSTPGLVVNLTTEQPGAPRMPYNEAMPDADVALIQRWLHDGAAGTCQGVADCLGPFVVPCITEDQSFNLDLVVPTVDPTQVMDCADLGAKMTPAVVMTCKKAACVQVGS